MKSSRTTNFVKDSLTNFASGMRTKKDKMSHAFFADLNIERDFRLLEQTYRTSWAAKKIVDIVADDMVREWRTFSCTNDKTDEICIIKKQEQKLDLVKKVNTALKWARLYGGGALLLNIRGQEDISQPLDLDRINKGDLLHINVIERPFVTVFESNNKFFDPSTANYDEPEYYWLANSTLKAHRSRLIIFKGEASSRASGNLNNFFWGDSIISHTYDSILNSESVNNVVASLVQEANVDIVKIRDLSAMISGTCGVDNLVKRFELANELKSTFNMLLIDSMGEEYDRKSINFSNLPQIIDSFLKVLSASANIPSIRFLNEAASGLSDTGDNDLRIYYDLIALKQRIELQHQLTLIDEVMFRSALGFMPDDIEFEFDSLWQISDDVKADIELKNSQVDLAYFNAGILSQQTILKSLQSNQRYQISDEDIESAAPPEFTNEDFDGENTRSPEDTEQEPAQEEDNSQGSEPPLASGSTLPDVN